MIYEEINIATYVSSCQDYEYKYRLDWQLYLFYVGGWISAAKVKQPHSIQVTNSYLRN